MILVHSASMVALHLAVFIKQKYVPYITNVGSESLPLGFGGNLGSKGAVSVNFDLGGMRMLFINCHLEAHDYAFEKRNLQWMNINNHFVHRKNKNYQRKKSLNSSQKIENLPGIKKKMDKKNKMASCCSCFGPSVDENAKILKNSGKRPSERIKHLELEAEQVDSSDSDKDWYKMKHWDTVVWMGDMNYRIQCSGPEVVYRLVAGDEWDLLTYND